MHKTTIRALQEIETRINHGIYAANSFLPPERRLCDELGIGRGALLAIFKQLSATGQVRIERGRGVRVLLRSEKLGLRRVIMAEDCSVTFKNSMEHLKLMEGIVKAATADGIEISLTFCEKEFATERLINHYARGEFNGVIVIEHIALLDINRLLRYGVPVLVANLETADRVPSVRVDFRQVGRTAGYELISQGHSNIGMLCGTEDSYISNQMLAGLRGALAEENLQILPENIIYWNSFSESEYILRKVLVSTHRPTAFFAARDWRAAKIYEACRELKINIPNDISVISYDNLSWHDAESSGLTTISEPFIEIGLHSINLLKKWLASGSIPEPVNVAGELIRRTSVSNIIA